MKAPWGRAAACSLGILSECSRIHWQCMGLSKSIKMHLSRSWTLAFPGCQLLTYIFFWHCSAYIVLQLFCFLLLLYSFKLIEPFYTYKELGSDWYVPLVMDFKEHLWHFLQPQTTSEVHLTHKRSDSQKWQYNLFQQRWTAGLNINY